MTGFERIHFLAAMLVVFLVTVYFLRIFAGLIVRYNAPQSC
jgi:hypothetical protein